MKIDPIKTEEKTKNIKTEETLRPTRITGGKETYRKLPISLFLKNKKIK